MCFFIPYLIDHKFYNKVKGFKATLIFPLSFATVICMDSNFTWFIRKKVDNDTELLIVPSWDWKPIDKFHNNWTIFRSIENGFTVVRSTYDGYSAVFEPYGQYMD